MGRSRLTLRYRPPYVFVIFILVPPVCSCPIGCVCVVYIKNIDLSFSEVLGPHGFIRVIFKKFLLGLLVSTAYLGNPLIANKFISDCFMCLLITSNTKSESLKKI